MVASNSSSAVMIARSWLAHISWPWAGVRLVFRTYGGLSERLASTGAGAGRHRCGGVLRLRDGALGRRCRPGW